MREVEITAHQGGRQFVTSVIENSLTRQRKNHMRRSLIACLAAICLTPYVHAEENAPGAAAPDDSIAQQLLALQKRVAALEAPPTIHQPKHPPVMALPAGSTLLPGVQVPVAIGAADYPRVVFAPAPAPPVPRGGHAGNSEYSNTSESVAAQTSAGNEKDEVSSDAAELTVLTIDVFKCAARSVRLTSDNANQTCVLEGNAKLAWGDVTITADRIQTTIPKKGRNSEGPSVACTGNCTLQQDDGLGEVFSGDNFELSHAGLRSTGNASLHIGSGDRSTVIMCDAFTSSHDGSIECDGTVRVHHRQSR